MIPQTLLLVMCLDKVSKEGLISWMESLVEYHALCRVGSRIFTLFTDACCLFNRRSAAGVTMWGASRKSEEGKEGGEEELHRAAIVYSIYSGMNV